MFEKGEKCCIKALPIFCKRDQLRMTGNLLQMILEVVTPGKLNANDIQEGISKWQSKRLNFVNTRGCDPIAVGADSKGLADLYYIFKRI